MKKSRFSEERIIGVLKEHQPEIPTAEACRKHGISAATFYSWRNRYDGMEVSDARRLKRLDEENRWLKMWNGTRLGSVPIVLVTVWLIRLALGGPGHGGWVLAE